MASNQYVLSTFVLVLSAHAALALGPASSPTQLYEAAGLRAVPWMRIHLCNGISKHTRTICCGTNPPAWCGKSREVNESSAEDAAASEALVPSGEKTTNDVTFIFRDPMFYVCMLVSVTVIYLVALAGSGRDRRPRESSL
jgi:hypothetical protein